MTFGLEALHSKIMYFIVFTHMIGTELAETFAFYKLWKISILRYSCSVRFPKLHVVTVMSQGIVIETMSVAQLSPCLVLWYIDMVYWNLLSKVKFYWKSRSKAQPTYVVYSVSLRPSLLLWSLKTSHSENLLPTSPPLPLFFLKLNQLKLLLAGIYHHTTF